MSLDFPGRSLIINAITEAVRSGTDDQTRTHRLREILPGLVQNQVIQLPGDCFTPPEGQYARRLIHRDAELKFTIMAMTWGPNQATPIHDHDGLWCVEAVWVGEIEVVQYELIEDQGQRVQFEPRTTMRAGRGSAGSLIPPHEYHTIANPSDDQIAVTLHIYADALEHCCIFEPIEGAWYERVEKQLTVDAA